MIERQQRDPDGTDFMARPRTFQEADVLLSAMEHFWQRGYEATSIRDVARAMGLTTASVYNAFGDKRAVYKRALEFYVERSVGDRIGRFEVRPPRQAVDAFFREIVDLSIADPKRRGCMLVNSAMELAPHDVEFQRVVSGVFGEIEAFFLRCVSKGQEDGTIAAHIGPNDLARMLLSTLLGLRVLARARPERALLEGAIRPILALLDPDALAAVARV
jgi:TetR/AcrR family transcriptional regulator, transcriptional repressor for nem operon